MVGENDDTNNVGDQSISSKQVSKKNDHKRFSRKDYVLIALLCAPLAILPWVDKWHELLVPVYVSGRKTVDKKYVHFSINYKLAFQSLLAIFLCAACDLLRKHYSVLCISLEIFTGAQIYGMIIYYTGPYEGADLVYWMSSTIFLAKTLIPYVVFSQNQNAPRPDSHLVLAASVLLVALSEYALFWASNTGNQALFTDLGKWAILPWVAVFFLITVITGLRFLRQHSPEGKPLKIPIKLSVQSSWRKVYSSTKFSVMRFGLFVTFLVPSLVAQAIHHSVQHVDIKPDLTMDLDAPSRHLILLGGVTGVVVIETILCVMNSLIPRPSRVLSLLLPIILYLIVVAIIFLRLTELRPLQEMAKESLEEDVENARVFEGPIPTKSQSVMEFYNVKNNTVEILSTHFVLDGPLSPFTRVGVSVGKTANVTIKIVLANGPQGKNSSSKCFCVIARVNTVRSYIVHGKGSNINLFRVEDHEHIRPEPLPKLVIMNSFMRAEDDNHRILIWEDTVGSTEVAFYQTLMGFSPNNSHVVEVPVGGVKITYENTDDDVDPRSPGVDESTNVLVTEPYVVYTILITSEGGKAFVDSYEVMRVSVRSDDTVVVPKIQDCEYVKAAFLLMGAAGSSMTIASLHHFWMDSPVFFRATTLAGYAIAHAVIKRLVVVNIGQLEIRTALAFIVLQATMVIWHLSVSYLFFFSNKCGYPAKKNGTLRLMEQLM